MTPGHEHEPGHGFPGHGEHSTRHSSPPVPRLGASYVLGQDGQWVLLFSPLSGELLWLDRDRTSRDPFAAEDDP